MAGAVREVDFLRIGRTALYWSLTSSLNYFDVDRGDPLVGRYGRADLYPRLTPTMEWDTAAAQAVVEQAGGRVIKTDGEPLDYNNKEAILNPWFLVIGPDDHDWLALVPNAE